LDPELWPQEGSLEMPSVASLRARFRDPIQR
jgi:hypothetical protein